MTRTELLKGEQERKVIVRVRSRVECENCGEPAIYRYTFLLTNYRNNPKSKAYGRDDCSWSSDTDVFTCAECKPQVPEDHCPAPGKHTLGEGNHHMFLEWREIDITGQLHLQGKCTDHVWLMEDGEEPSVIGVRMDCGDSGTVYLTRDQAADLADQLKSMLEVKTGGN
jgi:hypothetical protein